MPTLNKHRESSGPRSTGSQITLLCVCLGFIGGGIGTLVALYLGMASWPDARLFILSGIALGLGLASALAPNLLNKQHREASAPKQ